METPVDVSSSSQSSFKDPSVKGKAIQAFIETQPQWDGRWVSWDEKTRADCVRALIQDFLDDYGHGFDWIQAGQQASFVAASVFHEIYPFTMAGKPVPTLEIRVNSPEEGFSLTLRRLSLSLLPPVPVPGGANQAQGSPNTTFGVSSARASSRIDALSLPDAIISHLISSVGDKTQSEGKEGLMLVASFMVLWKSVQVSWTVCGGGIYRDIHHPENTAIPHGDVRFSYERLGSAAEQAKKESPDGGAYVLS